jgi:hypothetical protein
VRRPPECAACALPVAPSGDSWVCHVHGHVDPLWRPASPSYDDLAIHLSSAPDFPTYLPWPLPPGWRVTDFGVVGDLPHRVTATVTCCAGTSELDGPVDLIIVAEEPGVVLGARCAGRTQGGDPGDEIATSAPVARLRVDGMGTALWTVSAEGVEEFLDRSVFVGEADGRWLWLILRPASAMLLIEADWAMHDISDLGPALLALEFGGPPPRW